VVLASQNYPGPYPTGKIISGLKDAESINPDSVIVYQAGTTTENSNKDLLVTSGGRVLAVTGLSNSLIGALSSAYSAVEKIQFEGMQYRTDIGAKKLPKVPLASNTHLFHALSPLCSQLRLAVLGSTRGTDMQAIIDAIKTKELAAEISLVVSNKSDAYILQRAKDNGISTKFAN